MSRGGISLGKRTAFLSNSNENRKTYIFRGANNGRRTIRFYFRYNGHLCIHVRRNFWDTDFVYHYHDCLYIESVFIFRKGRQTGHHL